MNFYLKKKKENSKIFMLNKFSTSSRDFF